MGEEGLGSVGFGCDCGLFEGGYGGVAGGGGGGRELL